MSKAPNKQTEIFIEPDADGITHLCAGSGVGLATACGLWLGNNEVPGVIRSGSIHSVDCGDCKVMIADIKAALQQGNREERARRLARQTEAKP